MVLQNRNHFAHPLLKIYIKSPCRTGILNYSVVEVILLCNLLFTPIHKAVMLTSTNPQRHSLPDYPQYCSCHFSFLVKQYVLLEAVVAGTDPGWHSGRDKWMT